MCMGDEARELKEKIKAAKNEINSIKYGFKPNDGIVTILKVEKEFAQFEREITKFEQKHDMVVGMAGWMDDFSYWMDIFQKNIAYVEEKFVKKWVKSRIDLPDFCVQYFHVKIIEKNEEFIDFCDRGDWWDREEFIELCASPVITPPQSEDVSDDESDDESD